MTWISLSFPFLLLRKLRLRMFIGGNPGPTNPESRL